jgi:signal transduction histidine kinase
VPDDPNALRILDLEDDPVDTELIQANLMAGGISCEMTRVQTRADFEAALENGDFDLVLSDYSLPSFDGLSALELAKEIRPDVPFILVSGVIGEERAIEALKRGATHYVLKQSLERLVPAVRRAVREAEERTERRRAEEALREIRDAERRRIARDLHDGVLQDLSYTAAAIGLIMLEVEGTKLEERLQRTIDAVRRAAQALRDAVNDLRLEEEWDRPFLELMRSLVQRNRVMTRDLEISLEVGEGFPSSSLGETGTQLLRIIQEALTNARHHSRATSVVVTVEMEGSDLVAAVSDDGRGFRLSTASGVGLSSMRERAAVIGCKLEIESAVGQGTTVRLRIPMSQKG